MKNLDENNQEIFYGLIRFHWLSHEKSHVLSTLDVPYKGKSQDGEITFDLKDFPIPLRRILYNFLQTYEKQQQEDRPKINASSSSS